MDASIAAFSLLPSHTPDEHNVPESDVDIVIANSARKKFGMPTKQAGLMQIQSNDGTIEDDGRVMVTPTRSGTGADQASLETATQKKNRRSSEFLQKRVQERLSDSKATSARQPQNIVDEKIPKSEHNKPYQEALKRLSTDKLTSDQLDAIDKVWDYGPHYLGRTASLTGGCRFNISKLGTNGFTSQILLMPAADTHKDQAVHRYLQDLSQGEFRYMFGQHLIWYDIHADEFLSYTKDMHFQVVHALDRYNEAQQGVTIQIVDRRKAKQINGGRPTKDGLAAFYPALDLYDEFKVPKWEGWSTPSQIDLHPRKFTQEFISHGSIRLEDSRFRQAPIEKLLDDKLEDIFPAFRIPTNHLRSGLYGGQVYYRMVGYPPNEKAKKNGHIYSYDQCAQTVSFSYAFLKKVQKLARNFMNIREEQDPEGCEPHLHPFLSFLVFQKRERHDPVFLEWIKSHYKPADVLDLYDDGFGGCQKGFTHVATNLPGSMQYLDLIRDAQFVFGLSPLPPNLLEKENTTMPGLYTVEDAKNQKDAYASMAFDAAAQLQRRLKALAGRKRKRELINVSAGDAEATNPTQLADDVNIIAFDGATRGMAGVGTNEAEISSGEEQRTGPILLGWKDSESSS